jgi:hypothetical protein
VTARSFNFLGTHADSWRIIEALVREGGFRAVPDIHYEEPVATTFDRPDDALKASVLARDRIYLTGAFTVHPLRFSEIDFKEGTRYVVDEERGGPVIGYVGPACYEEDGATHLNFGSIYRQGQYWNPTSDTWEKPSAALAAHYDEAMRRAKAFMRRDAGRWIGLEARSLVAQGKARIDLPPRRSK